MQEVTDAERAILTGVAYGATYGCDVLDDSGAVTGTLDDDLVSCTVAHNAYAQVHRTVELDVQRELDWPNVWLRPWQSVHDAAGNSTRRYPLGVFRPETPEVPLGVRPKTWRVTGSDRLSLLTRAIGDNRWAEVGAVVQAAILAAIAESGVPGDVVASSDVASQTLSTRLAWVLDPSAPTTYLRWINDLCAAAGIRAVYMDGDGRFRLDMYAKPAARPATWTFDLTDKATNIVAQNRTASTSARNTVNWWRFLADNWPTFPVEGDGQYTVDLSGTAMKNRKITSLSAANQASLTSQGDQTVATDQGRTRTVEISMGPFPIFEHFDVVDYRDPDLSGDLLHGQVSQWSCDLKARTTTATLEVPVD